MKSKNAAFPQRFVVSGATTGNGTYNGVTATPAVTVTGNLWTIAIQHNPGSGFQLSDSKLVFPTQVGGNYEFDIQSNDSGNDQDFDDLILTCSTPAGSNDFIIYGNVSLYSGRCVFNPCRRDLFVLESPFAVESALKNATLRRILEEYYPERIPPIVDPNPPDPVVFKPIVIDLFGEAMQPKTLANVTRLEGTAPAAAKSKGKEAVPAEGTSTANFRVEESLATRGAAVSDTLISRNRFQIATAIDGLISPLCRTEAGNGLTLTFEEYDRTNAEQAGGPYTGTGNRRLLGDTVTDMFGNYIFRFSFDMTFPGIEDNTDTFPGQTADTYAYPDVIIKVTGVASWDVLYESPPYYNIRNLRRINLCLPKKTIRPTSSCANGNLIGGLGNVSIGGNQNTTASTGDAELRRYGNSNYLEETGVISVNNSSQADFTVECASWGGVIDIFGCIYDETKSLAANTIRWYTIRIRRSDTPTWTYVTENYKHPLFYKRNLPGYTGDDVGPFPVTIAGVPNTPAYKNIRWEVHSGGGAAGTDWIDHQIGRLMKLHTGLYDVVGGEHAPGTFYLRIDGYDAAGTLVAGKTDLIALYIHNKPLNFELTGITLDDPSIVNAGCGLYRLTDAQNNVPMKFSFKANDPFGFVNSYSLTMTRCPGETLALLADPMADTAAGAHTLAQGASGAIHSSCVGYTGTLADFMSAGSIAVTLQPNTSAGEVGWIKAGEYFTVYSFTLAAGKRVTNGYIYGVVGSGPISTQIMMEKLTP